WIGLTRSLCVNVRLVPLSSRQRRVGSLTIQNCGHLGACRRSQQRKAPSALLSVAVQRSKGRQQRRPTWVVVTFEIHEQLEALLARSLLMIEAREPEQTLQRVNARSEPEAPQPLQLVETAQAAQQATQLSERVRILRFATQNLHQRL